MEPILQYENRGQLYQPLVNQFGFIKVDEKYDPQHFGNFYITLSGEQFMLRYVNDRSQLTIEIASHTDPGNWCEVSFVKDFIYQPEKMNSGDPAKSNAERIDELNAFLAKDFDLISDLFNSENYSNTREEIDRLLKETFKRRSPGMLE